MPKSDDRLAVILYAVLARDVEDFMDRILEERNNETLRTLYLMLALPNKDHDERTLRMNEFGAGYVEGVLRQRGVKGRLLPGLDPALCDHPNECPAVCPCAPACYCQGRTCPLPPLEIEPPTKWDLLLEPDDT